ncbi:MAG: signal peptidase I [Polyangiaceae bacterium]
MRKTLRQLISLTGILAIIAGILRLTLLEPWVLPPEDGWLGASVAPTLASGDLVLVLTRGEPGFGDLVRCVDPEYEDSWVVGRIAGLTGDTVEIVGHTLRVNGRRYDVSDACHERRFTVKHPDSESELEMDCGRVDMGSGWHYRGTSRKVRPRNDKKKLVGAGRFFLISDNRDLHDDSRDFGTLPASDCTQRIVFRLWGAGGWADGKHRLTPIR